MRPDLDSDTLKLSIDVKNYDGGTKGARQNMMRDIRRQVENRLAHLPPGRRQGVIIDLRGQTISGESLERLRSEITRTSSGRVAADDIHFMLE